MSAHLIKYLMLSYSRSRRYFGPLAGLMIAMALFYSYKPNPVMNSYGATSVIQFICCAALGLSFLNHRHPVHKQITIVHLRSAKRYYTGELFVLVLYAAILALCIVAYPLVTGSFGEPAGWPRIGFALTAHFLLGLLGIAVSLYLQSAWIPETSYSTGLFLVVVVLSVGGSGIADELPESIRGLRLLLPPAASVMELFMRDDMPGTAKAAGVFGYTLFYSGVLITVYLLAAGKRDIARR